MMVVIVMVMIMVIVVVTMIMIVMIIVVRMGMPVRMPVRMPVVTVVMTPEDEKIDHVDQHANHRQNKHNWKMRWYIAVKHTYICCVCSWYKITVQPTTQRTSPVYRLRVADAIHRLPHQHARHQPHSHDRGQCTQHLHAVIAIGKIIVGRFGCHVASQQGYRKTAHVCQQVGCISQNCQAAWIHTMCGQVLCGVKHAAHLPAM